MTDMENMTLSNGTLLQGGKYRIVRFIGSGGFGNTYEAEHTMLHSRVAVKEFFVRDFCDRDETTEQVTICIASKRELVIKLKEKFIEEAQAISQMRHPNIVRVLDVFEENGTAYYVMDYIDGSSLDKMVRDNGSLSEQVAVKYIRQIANALAYVHARNRLHLDVKPGNIISDGSGNAFLIDFGASKQYDEAAGENTSTIMGKTPGYAPIEQMGNNTSSFTPATDIYALGATLYKLVSGNTPLEAVLLASGEKLVPLPQNISMRTRNVISAVMRVDKSKRPQNITEFLSLLNDEEKTILQEGNNVGSEITILDFKDGETTILSSPEPKQVRMQRYKRKPVVLGLSIFVGVIVLLTILPAIISKFLSTGHIYGHDYVDLGLSVKWATCNVGAFSPTGCGKYFSWGETKTKFLYTERNSATYNVLSIDQRIEGNSRYDAASDKWGGTWRMPTYIDIDELLCDCEWKPIKIIWFRGYKVIGPSGKSIFLPATGTKSCMLFREKWSTGEYWSSWGLPIEDAIMLYFDSETQYDDERCRIIGRVIRPVAE